MTVVLLITKIDGEEVDINAPFSTEAGFERCWVPLCERHGFQWIPLFHSGAIFNEKDLPYILSELELAREKLKDPENEVADSCIGYMYQRVDLILSKLEPLKDKKSLEFFIG